MPIFRHDGNDRASGVPIHKSEVCGGFSLSACPLPARDLTLVPALTLPWCAEDDAAERLRAVGPVKCIVVSSDGQLLGLSTEDGCVAVLEVPSMRTKAEIR